MEFEYNKEALVNATMLAGQSKDSFIQAKDACVSLKNAPYPKRLEIHRDSISQMCRNMENTELSIDNLYNFFYVDINGILEKMNVDFNLQTEADKLLDDFLEQQKQALNAEMKKRDSIVSYYENQKKDAQDEIAAIYEKYYVGSTYGTMGRGNYTDINLYNELSAEDKRKIAALNAKISGAERKIEDAKNEVNQLHDAYLYYQESQYLLDPEFSNKASNGKTLYEKSGVQAHAPVRGLTTNMAQTHITSNYNYLTDSEKDMLGYYFSIGGREAAEHYLNSKEDEINYRSGLEKAELYDRAISFVGNVSESVFGELPGSDVIETIGETLVTAGFSGAAGVDMFFQGIEQLTTEEAVGTSSWQVASSLIRSDLNTGQGFVWDMGTAVGNMAPGIIASVAVSAIPGVGPAASGIVGSTLLGLSAGGNAYNEALLDGYSIEAARKYGFVTGLAEGGMQYVLGGIGSLGGIATKAVGGSITNAATRNIASNNARNFLSKYSDYALGSLGEGTEEYIQGALGPVIRNVTLGENNEVKLIDKEYAYQALLGMATAGIFNGSVVVNDVASLGKYATNYGVDANLLMINPSEYLGAVYGASQYISNGDYVNASRLMNDVGDYEAASMIKRDGTEVSKQANDVTENVKSENNNVSENTESEPVVDNTNTNTNDNTTNNENNVTNENAEVNNESTQTSENIETNTETAQTNENTVSNEATENMNDNEVLQKFDDSKTSLAEEINKNNENIKASSDEFSKVASKLSDENITQNVDNSSEKGVKAENTTNNTGTNESSYTGANFATTGVAAAVGATAATTNKGTKKGKKHQKNNSEPVIYGKNGKIYVNKFKQNAKNKQVETKNETKEKPIANRIAENLVSGDINLLKKISNIYKNNNNNEMVELINQYLNDLSKGINNQGKLNQIIGNIALDLQSGSHSDSKTSLASQLTQVFDNNLNQKEEIIDVVENSPKKVKSSSKYKSPVPWWAIDSKTGMIKEKFRGRTLDNLQKDNIKYKGIVKTLLASATLLPTMPHLALGAMKINGSLWHIAPESVQSVLHSLNEGISTYFSNATFDSTSGIWNIPGVDSAANVIDGISSKLQVLLTSGSIITPTVRGLYKGIQHIKSKIGKGKIVETTGTNKLDLSEEISRLQKSREWAVEQYNNAPVGSKNLYETMINNLDRRLSDLGVQGVSNTNKLNPKEEISRLQKSREWAVEQYNNAPVGSKNLYETMINNLDRRLNDLGVESNSEQQVVTNENNLKQQVVSNNINKDVETLEKFAENYRNINNTEMAQNLQNKINELKGMDSTISGVNTGTDTGVNDEIVEILDTEVASSKPRRVGMETAEVTGIENAKQVLNNKTQEISDEQILSNFEESKTELVEEINKSDENIKASAAEFSKVASKLSSENITENSNIENKNSVNNENSTNNIEGINMASVATSGVAAATTNRGTKKGKKQNNSSESVIYGKNGKIYVNKFKTKEKQSSYVNNTQEALKKVDQVFETINDKIAESSNKFSTIISKLNNDEVLQSVTENSNQDKVIENNDLYKNDKKVTRGRVANLDGRINAFENQSSIALRGLNKLQSEISNQKADTGIEEFLKRDRVMSSKTEISDQVLEPVEEVAETMESEVVESVNSTKETLQFSDDVIDSTGNWYDRNYREQSKYYGSETLNKIVAQIIKTNEVPIDLRSDREILTELINENNYQYLSQFTDKALMNLGIESYNKIAMNLDKIDNLPEVLKENEELLEIVIKNNGYEYVNKFDAYAFKNLSSTALNELAANIELLGEIPSSLMTKRKNTLEPIFSFETSKPQFIDYVVKNGKYQYLSQFDSQVLSNLSDESLNTLANDIHKIISLPEVLQNNSDLLKMVIDKGNYKGLNLFDINTVSTLPKQYLDKIAENIEETINIFESLKYNSQFFESILDAGKYDYVAQFPAEVLENVSNEYALKMVENLDKIVEISEQQKSMQKLVDMFEGNTTDYTYKATKKYIIETLLTRMESIGNQEYVGKVMKGKSNFDSDKVSSKEKILESVEEVTETTETEVVEPTEEVVETTENEVAQPVEEVVETTENEVVEPTEEVVETTENEVAESIEGVTETTENEVVEPVEEVAETTETEVAQPTEEVAETAETEVVEPTEEVTETTETEVVEPIEEVVETTENEVAQPIEEVTEKIENLQKHRDEIQAELASKRQELKEAEAQSQAKLETYYNYSKQSVRSLIDELGPTGSRPIKPGTRDIDSELADAISEYYVQGENSIVKGENLLDTATMNEELSRYKRLLEADYRVKVRFNPSTEASARAELDRELEQYDAMQKIVDDYTQNVNDVVSATKQKVNLLADVVVLDNSVSSIGEEIERQTVTLEKLNQNTDDVAAEVVEPTEKVAETAETEVVEPTEEVVETAETEVVEPTEEVAETTENEVVEPTEEVVETAENEVAQPVKEEVETAENEVAQPVEEAVETTETEVVEPTEEVAETTENEVVEPTEEVVAETAETEVAQPIEEVTEKIENLQKHRDEIQAELASKRQELKEAEAQSQAKLETYYNYSKQSVRSLIDELGPTGSRPIKPGTRDIDSELADAISEYYVQGENSIVKGENLLDTATMNKELSRYKRLLEAYYRVKVRFNPSTEASARAELDRELEQYDAMQKIVDDYTQSVNDVVSATKQKVNLLADVVVLDNIVSSIGEEIERQTVTLEKLNQNTDDVATEVAEPTEEAVETTENEVVEPTEEVAETAETEVVEPTEEVAETTETEVVEPTEEVSETTETEVAEPTEEVVETTGTEVVEPTEEVAETTETEVAQPAEEVAETTENEVVEPTEEVAETTETEVAQPAEEVAETTENEVVEPIEEVVETTENEVVEPTEEVAETAETEVVEPTEEVAETTGTEVVEPTEEVSETTETEVAEPTEEVVETTGTEVVEPTEEVAETTETEVAQPAEEVVETTGTEVVEPTEEVAETTETEVAQPAEEVAETTENEVVEPIEEVVETTENEVVEPTEEVAETAETEVAQPVEEAVETTETEVAQPAEEVVETTGTEVVEPTEEVAETTEEVVETTGTEVVEPTEEVAETTETEVAQPAEEVAETTENEVVEPIEEVPIFSSNKGGTKNFFRRANNISNSVPNEPVMTEIQQQWVDYINYNISIGNKVTVPFNSTSEISSVMLSKIADLSQVDIQLLDGLGDGNGMLKEKYQAQRYVNRITYSGHEMNAIINRIEELQSKIDMSLPPSQRARQIYDILGSEVPIMRDFGSIPNGHEISASLRGLTPINSAGKEGLVCAGYSCVYKELCERADIPCTYVRGIGNMDPLRGGQPGGHAWNVVHTEIGDIPVDVTWNASENGTSKWFGASDDFAATHWSDPDELYQNYSSSAGMTPRYSLRTSTDNLNDVIRTMEQKYGSRSEAIKRLEAYVSTGDARYVTSENDARDMVLTTEAADVQNYVYYARQNNNIQQIVDIMNYKYGDTTSSYTRLRNYVTTGNVAEVTRTNGARDLLVSVDVNLIDQYLRRLGW